MEINLKQIFKNPIGAILGGVAGSLLASVLNVILLVSLIGIPLMWITHAVLIILGAFWGSENIKISTK